MKRSWANLATARFAALCAALGLVSALAVLPAACLGDIQAQPPPPGSGGAGGEGGSLSAGGDAEGGNDERCLTPPDGFCDEESDCLCTSCASAAACVEGGCMANGFCDLTFEDSCVCSDCDSDSACLSPMGGGNCTDDGTCETDVENCACADCFDMPTCADNQQLCAGGAPDGQCTPQTESCGCNDCLGAFECMCQDDGFCDFTEPCVCLDCQIDDFCSDPLNCTDDLECNLIIEGCQCLDCSAAPTCP